MAKDTTASTKKSSPQTNRRIRVFVSSTFRDMIEVRNVLVSHAWPELRRFCRERQLDALRKFPDHVSAVFVMGVRSQHKTFFPSYPLSSSATHYPQSPTPPTAAQPPGSRRRI